jgi:hypothetical protein
MHIEIDLDAQGRPRSIAATDVPLSGANAGEPRLTETVVASLPTTAENAGPPAATMEHPLAPPPAGSTATGIPEVRDGGAAPQFD